ncbi:hypothetical protein BT69DRAFT_1280451 [Atractiella rhizophila]|nr:hypothetical protein BT69DRAFT_1280451 [Atractiella rhizophila]
MFVTASSDNPYDNPMTQPFSSPPTDTKCSACHLCAGTAGVNTEPLANNASLGLSLSSLPYILVHCRIVEGLAILENTPFSRSVKRFRGYR